VRVTYSEAAQTDLIRQFRYYLVTLELPRVALRFREAVKRTVKDISLHPNISTPCHLRNPRFRAFVVGP
jgi:plasmid stabilization system protein ParE